MDSDELRAGPELNALIAEWVMGWQRRNDAHFINPSDGQIYCINPDANEYAVPLGRGNGESEEFCPSTDLNAAWMVVEYILNRGGDNEDDALYNYFYNTLKDNPHYLLAATSEVCLTICDCALNAVHEAETI